MASNPSTLLIVSLFLLLFFSPSLADDDFVTSLFSSTLDPICEFTPHPDFCKANLPRDKPGTIHDYGRYSVHQSLSEARKFQSLVDRYRKLPSTTYLSTIRALEDCSLLAGMNIDYLSHASNTINSTHTLHSLQADDLHTLLSALLTNQQTCLDGLLETASASSIMEALFAPLQNGAKFYSVSLALVIHGWFSWTKNGRWLTERKHVFSNMRNGINGDHLPLKMSSRDRKIYESVSGRKLLQGNDDQYVDNVSVSQMVVVNPNETADYTTISDAVAAAPNSTDGSSNGYYLIYVAAGVYEEYVSIPKQKKNLMMIGAGKGLTVITGNRSYVDGWTTFNTATFGKVHNFTSPYFILDFMFKFFRSIYFLLLLYKLLKLKYSYDTVAYFHGRQFIFYAPIKLITWQLLD